MSEDKTNYLDDVMKLVDDRINLCQSNLNMFCKLVEYVGYDFVCTWPINGKSYGISFGPYALCSTISRFSSTNLICITFDSSFHVPYKWELRKFRRFFSMMDATYIIATNTLAIIKESLESGKNVFGHDVPAFHYADYSIPSSKILFDHRKSIEEICIDADLYDNAYDE